MAQGCSNNPCFLQVDLAHGLVTQGSCRCLDGIPAAQRLKIQGALLTMRARLRSALHALDPFATIADEYEEFREDSGLCVVQKRPGPNVGILVRDARRARRVRLMLKG